MPSISNSFKFSNAVINENSCNLDNLFFDIFNISIVDGSTCVASVIDDILLLFKYNDIKLLNPIKLGKLIKLFDDNSKYIKFIQPKREFDLV